MDAAAKLRRFNEYGNRGQVPVPMAGSAVVAELRAIGMAAS